MKKTLQTSLSVRDMVELLKALGDLENFTWANRRELIAVKKRKRPR